MNKIPGIIVCTLLWASSIHADTFGSGENAFDIEFVTVGNPGNPWDALAFPEAPVGSVGYTYRIGKHEVSRDMINKANSLGSLGITMADMATWGGNEIHKPASGVSLFEAAKFVNWLNTSNGYSPAYKFESLGMFFAPWNIGDEGFDANNRLRNSSAKYFVTSHDEWHKAAYFDPYENVYYWSPVGSNTIPIAVASGTAPGTAVINQPQLAGPAEIYSAGDLGLYGTMAQGGNVFENVEIEYDLVNDEVIFESESGARGGDWGYSVGGWIANVRLGGSPYAEHPTVGFRIASKFEPMLGDFDQNGKVGGRDFLAWQRGESPNPHYSSDLVDWQDKYASGSLATATIPEPTGLVLLALGSLVLVSCRN